MPPEITLTVVDQSPVRAGGDAAQALTETVALAVAAEAAGYDRYWVTEHHNSGSLAGTAPEILIGQIAAHTDRIRVGSAGVMLTHYSAFKVSEVFKLLSAFYPGRIDLGIGRAPGSDQQTAAALAYPKPVMDVQHFPGQVADVLAYLHDAVPEGHVFTGLRAQAGPLLEGRPEVWLLGSSDYSAQLAAAMGLPFAFADFFGYAGEQGPAIAAMYRTHFKPSQYLQEPRANVTLNVFCAETDERARFLNSSRRLQVAQSRTGQRRQPLLPPDEAWPIVSHSENAPIVERFTKHMIEGSPETVRERVLDAVDRYQTTDVGINTNTFAYEDRLRSYQLVAEAFGWRPVQAATQAD